MTKELIIQILNSEYKWEFLDLFVGQDQVKFEKFKNIIGFYGDINTLVLDVKDITLNYFTVMGLLLFSQSYENLAYFLSIPYIGIVFLAINFGPISVFTIPYFYYLCLIHLKKNEIFHEKFNDLLADWIIQEININNVTGEFLNFAQGLINAY